MLMDVDHASGSYNSGNRQLSSKTNKYKEMRGRSVKCTVADPNLQRQLCHTKLTAYSSFSLLLPCTSTDTHAPAITDITSEEHSIHPSIHPLKGLMVPLHHLLYLPFYLLLFCT